MRAPLAPITHVGEEPFGENQGGPREPGLDARLSALALIDEEAGSFYLQARLASWGGSYAPWKGGTPYSKGLAAPTTVPTCLPLGLPAGGLPTTPTETLDAWRRGWLVSLVLRPHRWARYIRH